MAEDKKAKAAPSRTVTAVKKNEEEPKGLKRFFKRIGKWFREMKSELKKVIWPTPKELRTNTLVSLVVMLVSALGIWIFDQGAQLIVKGIFALCK